MAKYPHPIVGTIQEFTIKAIGFYTDSQGAFYEVFTQEGPSILTGVEEGEAVVHVDGRGTYSGPHADRVLREVRQAFKDSHGHDPENPDFHSIQVLDQYSKKH